MPALSAEHFRCRHHHHHLRTLPRGEAPNRGERIGAAGVGDPYFPTMGNGGYDALHYDLNLRVDPVKQHLSATTTMQAKALQDLDAFNLDFRNFEVARILVNGKNARFERDEGELTVRPDVALLAGQDFSVQVDYAGKPVPYESEHAPITIGWNHTKDGSYVLSEPDGSSTWYPVNDHPRDKATYKFFVTVPNGYQAVCNGQLVDKQIQGDQTTWVWDAKDPMASYLSTVNVGKWVEHQSVGPKGVPIHNFFPARVDKLAQIDFGRVPQMMEWFGERFGDYPFETYGNLVLNASVGGAALETQTRPVFERGMITGARLAEFVVAHELAHQWWGNSTSVQNWKDIWLSEGFANYCHLMWKHEHEGGISKLDRAMFNVYNDLPKKDAPVSDPGENSMFSENVYNRGAVTLHLLRKELGDETFFSTLRAYSKEFRGKNVTTDDFVNTVNRESGRDMTAFFDRWVRQEELPEWPAGVKVPPDQA